jgi:hypothetical protein
MQVPPFVETVSRRIVLEKYFRRWDKGEGPHKNFTLRDKRQFTLCRKFIVANRSLTMGGEYMNNVVPIPARNRNFMPYTLSGNTRQTFDSGFFLGVAVFVVLPQIAAVTYFGPAMAVIFGACSGVAVIVGLTIYRRFPYRIPRIVPSAVRRVPARPEVTRRKAA